MFLKPTCGEGTSSPELPETKGGSPKCQSLVSERMAVNWETHLSAVSPGEQVTHTVPRSLASPTEQEMCMWKKTRSFSWHREAQSHRLADESKCNAKCKKMQENSGVRMDSEDWEREEPQCCSEDPARSPLEPGPSLTSMSSAHSCKAPGWTDEEMFFVLASHLSSACEQKGSPILLAVSKGELCLCCDKDKGQSKPSRKEIYQPGCLERTSTLAFIFYRAKVGSQNTLELAAHARWFICTSCNSGEPVGVTDILGKRKHTEFSFWRVPKADVSPSEVTE
ncbi:hypothetical protein HPG69_011235 [Diceros bicornis minor]|uniref:Interleukin-1 n=1 Tax=Diceros bicornis minor TaxID=77932 RepID=A0A7J7FDJ6_DICBM|nr:hypothetical protein HPG69_011235 [Diceros bicornis minor]